MASPKKQNENILQAPTDPSEQIIVRLVMKIAELDEENTKLVAFKLGAHTELMEMHERLSVLESQFNIIKSKLDQSRLPSLLDEFMTYKQLHQKVSKKKSVGKVPRRKKL